MASCILGVASGRLSNPNLLDTMNSKKSQTATEYLIILAVVIVIALIVVGVLGGLPNQQREFNWPL